MLNSIKKIQSVEYYYNSYLTSEELTSEQQIRTKDKIIITNEIELQIFQKFIPMDEFSIVKGFRPVIIIYTNGSKDL
ncbi:MAG: hypothetical protein ABIO44_01385, partial [Saprospiraceae bacterium]